MKGFRRAVLPLCVVLAFLADAATAQTNTPARSVRQYNSRVQMHTAPVTLQAPDDSLETQKGTPESMERELMIPTYMPQESQIRPNGPRLRAMPEKQQNKNWILPSSTETKKEKTTLNQQEEIAPSGWGWLADDVRARQLRREDDREKDDSKEKDNELQPLFVLQKGDVNPKKDPRRHEGRVPGPFRRGRRLPAPAPTSRRYGRSGRAGRRRRRPGGQGCRWTGSPMPGRPARRPASHGESATSGPLRSCPSCRPKVPTCRRASSASRLACCALALSCN